MAAAYYRGFSVAEIDSDGFVQPVVSIDLDVENITAGGSLGTVSVDANGIVAEGSFGAAPGDVVEFSHGSYPKKFRQTLTGTQDQAYLHPDNNTVTFILDNSYASTNEVTDADLYAQDLDDMGQRPQLLGTVKAGETTKIPYQTSVAKNLRLMLVSKDNFGSQDVADFAYAQSEDLSVPALAPGTVTSVAMTVPSFLSVSGSPITGSGTLAVTLANQSAKTFLAGPTSGSAAAPTFRAIAMADLGTGSPSSSNFLRGDGSWQTVSASPAGSNTQIQFNDSSAFGGDSDLTWDKTNNILGVGSMQLRSPASSVIFVGATAGGNRVGGTDQTGVGYEALRSALAGSSISAYGSAAGYSATSAPNLSLFGTSSGALLTTQGNNALFGEQSGQLINGSFNAAFGIKALRGGVTNAVSTRNSAFGYESMFYVDGGTDNSCFGYQAGANITSAIGSSLFGVGAGNAVTTASAPTAFGYESLYSLTSGVRNTGGGYQAGYSITSNGDSTYYGFRAGRLSTGNYCTYVGSECGPNVSSSSGEANSAFGYYAGRWLTSGQQNTLLGYGAGGTVATGSGNVLIGYLAGYNETDSDKLYIANSTTSTPLIYGEFNNALLHWNATKVRQKYDGSNYYDSDVSSAGHVTFNAVGSSAGFTFSDAVTVPDEAYSSSWNANLTVPTKNALYDHFSDMGWAKNNQTLGSPTTGDDNTQGFGPGSNWTDISGGKVYHCFDASTGAADWQLLN